jgi:hypothetical protein
MEKNCDGCGSRRFRISRFRLADVPWLFLFRYPVRCVECEQRSYGSARWVLELRRKKANRARSRT